MEEGHDVGGLADVTVSVLMMKQLVMGDGGRDVEMIGVVVLFTILRFKIKGNVYYLL